MDVKVWSFVTDVEGNLDYWNNFIHLSKVIRREGNGKLVLNDHCGFIFGGDSVDKGIGDMTVVYDLLQLKHDYPSRVFLIIGNRDSNKLRFASELENKESLEIPELKPAWWVPPFTIRKVDDYLKQENLPDTRSSWLQWMLAETMGCATTFQLRKEALRVAHKPFGDDDVTKSFIDSVSIDSQDHFMLQYLSEGNIMVRVGSTLFVHGGINDINLGAVPGDDKPRDSVDEWMEDLNEWKQRQLQDYKEQPKWMDSNSKSRTRGGNELIDYGKPGGNNDKTVIYAYHLPNSNAEYLSLKTEEYLVRNGIRRIVVGHQPHGDCPSVISSHSVQVVTGDTSYSDVSASDNRGCAVSEILLYEDDQSVEVHGILSDKREIAYTIPCPGVPTSKNTDKLIGKKLKDNSWVKSKLAHTQNDGKQYLICKGSGYTLHLEWLTIEEVESRLE